MQHEANKFSKANEAKPKNYLKRSIAGFALLATTAGAGYGISKMDSEGFAKWNAGGDSAVLDVHANSPSLVTDRKYEWKGSAKNRHRVFEIKIRQVEETAKAADIREDWVKIHEDDYKSTEIGESVIVQQLEPDWSNELLDGYKYDVVEIQHKAK